MTFVSFMSPAHYCLRSPHFGWLDRRLAIGLPLFCFFSRRHSCSRFLSCRKHLFFGQPSGDTPDRIRAFAQHRHIWLPIAFDPEQATMRAFGLTGFPNLVVIDRTGHARLTHTGYNSSETNFRRDLTQLLQNL